MKCSEVGFGTFECCYTIDLPYLVSGKRKTVAIDKCLLPEVISLWEQGIRTTGCCCGHGKAELAYIGVDPFYKERMEKLGYTLNCYQNAYVPKTPLVYGETKT